MRWRLVANGDEKANYCESGSPRLSLKLDPYRHERISESIREELDELIAYEMSDPRVGSAAVTEVLIAHDYRKAVVRLALIGTPKEQAETLAALNHAKQFLRHELTERLQLFKSPELHFEAGIGKRGEVRGHDRHCTAEVAEGRGDHALVLDLDQSWDTAFDRSLEEGECRSQPLPGRELRVLLTGDLLAPRLALIVAFFRGFPMHEGTVQPMAYLVQARG